MVSAEQTVSIDVAKRAWQEVVSLDPMLNQSDVEWYVAGGLNLMLTKPIEGPAVIQGMVDESFPQPVASTSSVHRVKTDGETLIVKAFRPHGHPFYVRSHVAQALMYSTEQALGNQQFVSAHEADDFNKRVWIMEAGQQGDVRLRRYAIGDEVGATEQIVSVMAEAKGKTLALEMHEGHLSDDDLREIFVDLTRRSMTIAQDMPKELADTFGSFEYILARIHEHTPGQLSKQNWKSALPYEHLVGQATEFRARADDLLRNDSALRQTLLREPYARRGGDVRPTNTMVCGNKVEVVLDQIALLTDPAPGKWGGDRVSMVPWGMASDTYELAFLFPDLIAQGKEDLVDAMIVEFSRHAARYEGRHWDDLSSPEIRALRLWVSMKLMEMAGLSTFNVADERLSGIERDYLETVIGTYGSYSIQILEGLAA